MLETSSGNNLHCHMLQKGVQPQSVPVPPPPIIVTAPMDAKPSPIKEANQYEEECTDGMLDRISHDLDYLLNRKTESPKKHTIVTNQQSIPVPPGQGISKSSCNLSVHEVIIEESEE